MGTMTEPVAGSGSCPSWIARVSKSMSPILVTEVGPPDRRNPPRIRDLPGSEPLRQAFHRASDAGACPLRRARFREDAQHSQRSSLAVEGGLDATDDPIPAQDRKHVVTVLAFRLRD